MSATERDDLFVRSTRYSKWLRFYDKQIGTGANTTSFERGIRYLVSVWSKSAHYSDLDYVEIVTSVRKNDPDEMGVVKRKLKKELLLRLKKRFDLRFSLRIFLDPGGDFHARHLETSSTILLMERGFDLLRTQDTFKRSFVKLDREARLHLKDYRSLECIAEVHC